MFVDAGAALGTVDDADGHVVSLEEDASQVDAPCADLVATVDCGFPLAGAKSHAPATVTTARGVQRIRSAVATNPVAGVVVFFRWGAVVRQLSEGVGLALEDVGITANQVADGGDRRVGGAGDFPVNDFVFIKPAEDGG